MEFSLRGSSFKKSSHGSSSSKQRSRSQNISSPSDHHPDDDEDDDDDEDEEEERQLEEHHPILTQHRRQSHNTTPSLEIVSTPYPTRPLAGEVILKIDATPSDTTPSDTTIDFDVNNNKIKHKSKHKNRSSSSDAASPSFWKMEKENPTFGEFSFRKSDDNVVEGQYYNHDHDHRYKGHDEARGVVASSPSDPTSKIIGQFLENQKVAGEMLLDMDLEMDELRQQQQQQDHAQRRGQGLPPLPPDSLSRQSWSRNQSDVQSPDFSAYNNYRNVASHIINTTANSSITTSNNNADGSREIRVSFQESFNSEQIRRRASVYSTVDGGSTSPSTSTTGDDDGHDGDEDDLGGSRIRHGGVYSRRMSNRNNNHSGEILQCTSNNASLRRLPSISATSKTRSRLMDPPPTPPDQRSGGIPKSGPINMRSGLLGKSMMDEEEEDPFFEDDFPDDFKKGQISTLVVLEWVSLVILMGAFICSLIIPVLKTKSLWKMRLWKWELLILVLICGRLVSDWGIRVLVFFIERNFLLRKRVLYFVYGLKKAVQNVIWLGLVLLTWHFLFDKRVGTESRSEPLRIITKLLVIGEACALLWLLKTLLVKVCASTFHVNAFFDRIQESLFNQFVIETLSGPSLFEFHQAQEEEERTMAEVQILQNAGINVPPDLRASVLPRTKSGKSIQPTQSGKIIGGNGTPSNYKSPIGQSTRLSGPISKKHDDGITIDHLHKLNQKNVSAWNMKRLVRIVRHGALTTLDEHIVDAATQDDESATQIRSEVEAKAAARKIFRNVARPRCRYIYLDDLMRFMREDEAIRTMGLFEGGVENERISKSALKTWVVNAFRERRALSLTLSDTKTAVNKLHKIVNVIVSAIIILIVSISFNFITSKSLLFLSSQIVVVAFVFGNTCKNVFESIIFLFVIHPFDVGDRCEIDGVQMVVEEMNILTTVFLRFDNLKIVFPNYILLTKPINNFYRSPDMGDSIEFLFHIATPVEKITLIRQRISSYIESKKEHWYPNPIIILKDAEHLNMLRIAVWIQHRMNHQDMGEKWIRRAILLEECIKIFRELDIEYRVYPLNVNVHSMLPLNFPNIPSCTPPFEGNKEVVHP